MPTSNDEEQIRGKADSVMNSGRVVRSADAAYFIPHHGSALPIHDLKFRQFVASICRLAPNAKITKKVITVIEARAFQSHEVLRVVQGSDAVAVVNEERLWLLNVGGQVFEISPRGRSKVPNGSHGILFLDPAGFAPVPLTPEQEAWAGAGGSYLRKLIIDRLPPPAGFLSAGEVAALMIATWFTAFMASIVRGKPIVLLLGHAGVGKSVTQRLLAKAFYGPTGNTTGGMKGDREMKDLFAGATHKPVIFRDDVNRMKGDAIDSLCQIATGMTLDISTFHETLALSSFEVLTFLVLSAFKPTWLGRVDLMSRMIPVEFTSGQQTTITEQQRTDEVLRARGWIWAETLLALTEAQKLAKPTSPSPTRFDDWYGEIHRVMQVYDLAVEFESAFSKIKSEWVRIICDANVEVSAVYALAKNRRWGRNEWSAAQLADALATNDGAAAHPRDHHVAPNIARDHHRLAMLLQKIATDFSGVITIVSRRSHDNCNVYRMWPADQSDPLAAASAPDEE